MFSDKKSVVKFLFLVLALGLPFGFLLNYYSENSTHGVVSPVVFGKGVGSRTTNSSPFSSLFKKVVTQSYQSQAPSAVTLSYGDSGSVLGERTTSDGINGLSGPGRSSNATSSGNSTAAPTTTSTSASYNPSSNNSNQLTGDASDTVTVLDTTQQAVDDVTSVIITYLKLGNYTALYNLMSSDFKNTFGLEDFISSFSGSPTVATGVVTSVPKIYGASNEWAEQPIRLTLSDTSVQNYLNIYHLEGAGVNSAWTLFATQDQ